MLQEPETVPEKETIGEPETIREEEIIPETEMYRGEYLVRGPEKPLEEDNMEVSMDVKVPEEPHVDVVEKSAEATVLDIQEDAPEQAIGMSMSRAM